LKVLPTRSSNIVAESQQVTQNISIRKGQQLNSTSFKELQASLRESMDEIRNTSSKIDRQSLLNLAEQSLVNVSSLNCDSKYGLRDLFKLGVQWTQFKESLEDPTQIQETVENTEAEKNSDQNIDTGKEHAYGAEGSPVNHGDEVTIKGEVTDVEESREYAKNLEQGLNLVEESLRTTAKENKVLRDELISSVNRINLLNRAYTNMKGLKESITKDLMKEQLRSSQLRSIQESRDRFFKSKVNSSTGVNAKLIEDNVSLIKENQTLAKSAAAYRVTAEQLAEMNLKLATKVVK